MSGAYEAALLRGAAQLGIEVGEGLARAMAAHHALVVKWAQKMNLTTVVEDAAAANLHGLDSLLLASLFDPDGALEVVDVGSGAGFPGLVLALARPKLRVTLMEPQRKRASFLRVAIAELARPDVRVIESRLDPLRPGAAPGWTADAIVSRATIPPLELVPLAAPHLRPGGRLFVMEGAGAPSPAELARAGLTHSARHEHVLPGGERRILDVLGRPA